MPRDVPPQRLEGKKDLGVALLLVDEVGFQPLTRLEAGLLFRLAGYRYQRGRLTPTTNKSLKDWPEILAGDEVMTTALFDRLLHKSHVLNIRGCSYRLVDLREDAQVGVRHVAELLGDLEQAELATGTLREAG